MIKNTPKPSNHTPHKTPAPAVKAVNAPDTSTNGLAIASLVLGIVSFTGFGLLTGIPAVITGIMAIKKGQKERSMSLAGIIMGAIATFFSLLFIGFLLLLIVMGAMNGLDSGTFEQDLNPEHDYFLESSRT